jgi:hypothetical protein
MGVVNTSEACTVFDIKVTSLPLYLFGVGSKVH